MSRESSYKMHYLSIEINSTDFFLEQSQFECRNTLSEHCLESFLDKLCLIPIAILGHFVKAAPHLCTHLFEGLIISSVCFLGWEGCTS